MIKLYGKASYEPLLFQLFLEQLLEHFIKRIAEIVKMMWLE